MTKKKNLQLYLILFSMLMSIYGEAQNRVDKPFQIHLNGSGLFLKAFGNSLSDSEIDELAIDKWILPGITIGYHINKNLYLGYAFQPNRNLTLKEPWTFGDAENDGNLNLNHDTGSFHSLEGRYFPFGIDLYGALFYTHVTKANYSMQLIRQNENLTIGNNNYTTDLDSDWNFKSLNTVGLGIGYNYVHSSSFSFDLGLGIPIPFNTPLYENIDIKSKQGIRIDTADLDFAKQKIENELFYFPVQLHLNVGYNFR